jgi:hypothetical protein
MIKYFSVSNFSSIKDEIIFEADIGSKNQIDTNFRSGMSNYYSKLQNVLM